MKRTVVTVAGALVAALLVGAGLVAFSRSAAPTLPTHPEGWSADGGHANAVVTPTPFPAPDKVFLGVQTNPGAYDLTPVDAFTTATGHRPAVLQFSQGWAVDAFDASRFDAIATKGMLPIVAWEPWDYRVADHVGTQPAYRLSSIVDGAYDDYVRSWATGVAALPYPVVIRFAHEMNGARYPWCEQSNGNRPGEYIAAWRHVHDIFTAAGADNAAWMWSPNVTYPGAAPLAALYPGDDYVDWIGLSGYYGTAGREAYLSFDEIFSGTLTELAALTSRPVVISETGATNASGQRVRWINELFAQLPQYPQVIGLIWFEATKEIDWRIAGDPAAAGAFATGAAKSRYDTPWAVNGVPRR